MYLLDPQAGRRRRALIRDKAVLATRKTREGAAALGCDLQNRLAGLTSEWRGWLQDDDADDRVIEARVRAALGRVCSHPSAIAVSTSNGEVTLSGPILSSEHAAVLRTVRRVRGVAGVDDRLAAHDQPGNVPALQGGSTRPGQMWLQGSWSPTSQMIAAVAGAGLMAYGARRGMRGSA